MRGFIAPASSVFVYTKTIFALQNTCWEILSLQNVLDVEKVAIGGGISKQPLLLESLRSAYDGLYASRAGQAYMEGLPRCQIVPCAFSSEANQVGVAAAYFEAMQKKC